MSIIALHGVGNAGMFEKVILWTICGHFVVDLWSFCGRFVVIFRSITGRREYGTVPTRLPCRAYPSKQTHNHTTSVWENAPSELPQRKLASNATAAEKPTTTTSINNNDSPTLEIMSRCE